jgi:hypothetical protein
MLALRYLYVLALAVWLGGAVVLSVLTEDVYAAGPVLFGGAPVRFEYIGYFCGAMIGVTLSAMALLGPRPTGFAYRLILVAAMLGATWSQFRPATIVCGLALLAWEARDHPR